MSSHRAPHVVPRASHFDVPPKLSALNCCVAGTVGTMAATLRHAEPIAQGRLVFEQLHSCLSASRSRHRCANDTLTLLVAFEGDTQVFPQPGTLHYKMPQPALSPLIGNKAESIIMSHVNAHGSRSHCLCSYSPSPWLCPPRNLSPCCNTSAIKHTLPTNAT